MTTPNTPELESAAETSNEATYSGEILLKMPKSLHRKLAEAAIQEGIDLNQYLVTILTEQSAVSKIQSKLDELNRQFARKESLAYSRERTTPYTRYVEDVELGIND